MLAKCSRCSQTFQTDRFGEQFCPFCGAAVMISPPASAPPGAPPPGGGITLLTGPQDRDAPNDAPGQHGGWLQATVTTWKESLFHPVVFFSRLKPGPLGGALGYGIPMLLLGGIAAGLNQILNALLMGPIQRAQAAQFHEQMAQAPEDVRRMMAPFEKVMAFNQQFAGQPHAWMLVFYPLYLLVMFFVGAAFLHVALMLVGGAKAGFTATIRAMAFSQGPLLLYVVPVVGGMVGGIWALVLNVMALSGLHKVSVPRVLGAYGLLILLSCCCMCGGAVLVGMSLGMHGAGPGAFGGP